MSILLDHPSIFSSIAYLHSLLPPRAIPGRRTALSRPNQRLAALGAVKAVHESPVVTVGLRADEAVCRIVEAAARVKALVHRGKVVLVPAATSVHEPLASAGVFVEAKPVTFDTVMKDVHGALSGQRLGLVDWGLDCSTV